MRGLIIKESLLNEQVPSRLHHFITSEHKHMLGGIKPVNILVLDVPETSANEVVFDTAFSLKSKYYYAHFISDDLIYVAFPMCVCVVKKNDLTSSRLAREVGHFFDIPDEQMKFEELFYKDHPNDYQ
jgi:hypothetical protein